MISWIHRVGTPWATRGCVDAISLASVGAETSASGSTSGGNGVSPAAATLLSTTDGRGRIRYANAAFASISGYQNVGAATTIAVLIASQLVGGLVIDLIRAHHVPLRALVGPLCGAVMLVIGAWLVARRQF